MAMSYQNFASLGVNLNRQKYGPLDISNVFTSDADLRYYLTKGAYTEGVSEYWYKSANDKVVPYPYEGQVLATVINGVVSVFALALDAEGNFITQEIGSKVTADEKSLTVDENGVVSILGFNAADNATLPQKTPVYKKGEDGEDTDEVDHYEIRWVPISAIVEGDGNTVSVVKAADGSAITVTESYDEEADTRTYTLDVTIPAVPEYTVSKTEGDGVVTYTVTKDGEKVGESIVVPNAYDDTDIASRLQTIEDNYLTKDDKYDDTELSEKVSALESAVGNADEGLVKAVADNAAAILAHDTAIGDNADAIVAEKERAEEAEAKVLEDAKTYTNEEIDGIDVAIEKKNSVDYIVIKNKEGTEIASVDASVFVQDSFLDDVAYDSATGKITFTWTMGDGSTKSDEVNVSDFVQTYTAGTGLSLADNQFSVDTSVIATVDALNEVRQTAAAAQTKEQVEQIVDGRFETANLGQYATSDYVGGELSKKLDISSYDEDKKDFAVKKDVEDALAEKVDNETLNSYYTSDDVDTNFVKKSALDEQVNFIEADIANRYTKEDTDALLDKKVDSATITHTTDTIAEGAKVEGTTLNIVVDAYTKAETLTKIQEKITEINGGESAGEVLGQLNSYKETNDARVGAIETKNGEQDTAIAAAQSKADKGVSDAAKVASDLASANLTIADNTREIGVVRDSVTTVNNTLSEKITLLENADVTINGAITSLQTVVNGENGHNSRINALELRATALEGKDADLAALIQGNTDKFGDYTTTEGLSALLADKADKKDTYTKEEVDDLLKNLDQSEIIADIEANATAIATLVGEDAGKSVRAIAGEEISALIKAADPTGNDIVIENIASLVRYVDENAGDISALTADVDTNKSKLAGIDTTVTAYVNGALAALMQPKASDEISVAEDGTLGIKEMNVNKLVQTTGEFLVLNGGNA